MKSNLYSNHNQRGYCLSLVLLILSGRNMENRLFLNPLSNSLLYTLPALSQLFSNLNSSSVFLSSKVTFCTLQVTRWALFHSFLICWKLPMLLHWRYWVEQSSLFILLKCILFSQQYTLATSLSSSFATAVWPLVPWCLLPQSRWNTSCFASQISPCKLILNFVLVFKCTRSLS